MASQEDLFKKIVSHCKEYGFVFPSSDIYDGLSAVYDYGQNGVELKNNIKRYWWEAMTRLHPNVVGIDSSIFMHPDIWRASGHIDAFNDPLIDNKDSKKRYRADVLIEDQIAKIEGKAEKEIDKARKRFGDSFDESLYRTTNPRVMGYLEQAEALRQRMAKALNDNDLEELRQIIIDEKIVCPISGTTNWTEVRQFNLMFATEVGSTADGASTIYLRPETAQGIFVNYLNVQKTGRMKLPFGIAQIGKAFRNEIVARQFIFRMREFEQMEMQYFVQPGTELEWFEYHSRTDFDLSRHEEFSGKKLRYYDPETKESYIPYVVETSIGVDRMFLSVLCGSYKEEQTESGETRVVLSLPPALAPVKLAVLPLVRKDGLDEKAHEVVRLLHLDFTCQYDEKDSIGKRYRRQDAIGTPYCITVDHQTLEDNTVTLRDRDTMQQERIAIAELHDLIAQRTSINTLLKKIEDEI